MNTPPVDEVSLHGMKFHALVGILPHERMLPQPIEIDLTVTVHPGSIVVDYRSLYELTAAVVAGGPMDFIEEIGDRIACAALGTNERIRLARVAIRKPHVPLPGPLEYAEVVVIRSADA